MKKMHCLAMLLCLLIAGTLFQAQPVLADETERQIRNLEEKGSIKVCLDEIGTPKDAVNLYCYKIGIPSVFENHLDGFTALDDFESLSLNLDSLGDTAVHRAYAEKLVSFIEENDHIVPVKKGVTDSAGICVFDGLDLGVYLIVQRSGFDTYGTIESFLMTVPYAEENVLIYDVVTQTKGETPVPPTETEPPVPPTETQPPDTEPEDPDKPAKTGDDKPIFEFTVIAVISAVCIAAALWRKQKKGDTV